MRYNVDIQKFALLLKQRPTLIKKITSLDEEMAAQLVEVAKSSFEYLSYELQNSLKVVRAFMVEDEEIKKTYPNRRTYDHELIPPSAIDKLSLKERKILISKVSNYNNTFFKAMPNKVYEEWLHAVEKGCIPIRDVPEKYHTRKTLYKSLAVNIKEEHNTVRDKIPEKFWENAEATQHILYCIRYTHLFIEVVPPKKVTKEHLIAAFSGKVSLDEEYQKIPAASWDKTLVAMALKSDARNISVIPPSLLTVDDALYAADNEVDMYSIPPQVLTREVKAHIAARATSPYNKAGQFKEHGDEGEFPELREVDFQCDVARIGREARPVTLFTGRQVRNRGGVKNIQVFVKPEDRHAVLKVCPEFIEYIPKREQTDETIDILLSKATSEELDSMDKYINLGKIKKHHAPLFIGCKSNLLLTTVEKKFKGVKRNITNTKVEDIKTKKTSSIVEINVAPVDFAKIREQLNKKFL